MPLTLKLRRSAGVPVTPAVHRRLAQANRARDDRDWEKAAEAYGGALSLAPELAHIWIQRGHALKELGDHAEAEAAYRQAASLRPDSAEPHLHLGHLHKTRGDRGAAARSYLRAAKLDPRQADALGELHDLAAAGSPVDLEDLLSILRAQDVWSSLDAAWDGSMDAAEETAGHDEQPGADAPTLVFDVSDLISYFRDARLPTGIQRVQLETIAGALRAGGRPVRVCAFAEHRDEWLEIPPAAFLTLCRLSLADGDRTAPDWVAAIARLRMEMTLADAIVFPTGAFLINLGTSWWLGNYFLFVRQAKARHGIRYVPFVHDLIPIMAGEHCTKELTRDFISWAIGAFEHADFFLVNSEATKRDLLKVAERLGHAVDPDTVAVIRLDADIRKATRVSAPKKPVGDWGLGREPFVLFVSTIESRKNHLGAFEAWIALIHRHGRRKVPKLVCVGNRGWLNDAIYAQLETHEGLRERVVMLSGLSDAELAWLYQSCLFTLYPSRYEGWGLPVTESLCYGKVPLISDASSLAEAGGPFAVTFESGCVPRLVGALEVLIYDAGFRAERERKIAEEFRPRRWIDIADQMAGHAAEWSMRPAGPDVPFNATLGAYHPIVRNFETRIWRGMRSAEVFRAGDGWWGPDDWGCWTKPPGGRLEIGAAASGPMRLYLRLHGLPTRVTPYRIRIAGADRLVEGVLKPGAFKWVALDVESWPVQGLSIDLEGSVAENLAEVTDGLDPRVAGVGLAGFFLCEADDTRTRADFLEAVALGNVEDLAFNREPPEHEPT
jgi:glycosyltransferase involved in cell wall biosynthesis